MQWCHNSISNVLLSTTVKICIQFKQKHHKVINNENVKSDRSFFGFIANDQMIDTVNLCVNSLQLNPKTNNQDKFQQQLPRQR